MSKKAPNTQLLGETLTLYYRLGCELHNTYPNGRYTHQLSQGMLALNISEMDFECWEAINHTLKNKITPVTIRVFMAAKRAGMFSVVVYSYEGWKLTVFCSPLVHGQIL